MRRIRTIADVLAGPDDYVSRLLKYIPAEVVAFYVSASGVIPSGYPKKLLFLWIIFGFCVVATPLYLFFATREKTAPPPWKQILLATIAFPVWAYALGGPFATAPGYQPFVGSLLLMAATFLFGIAK